jgi:hypothetical protein
LGWAAAISAKTVRKVAFDRLLATKMSSPEKVRFNGTGETVQKIRALGLAAVINSTIREIATKF